ncbi:hypothetical protein FACHB389_10715 [Nostoc calcicola FACHB-389]|nr:hypothetical protein [Nostoc calcicola FACHB-3891]OKH36977.1 hypothetical protein FACHB389_10715 [Nostoc calcicola FACHB-389]
MIIKEAAEFLSATTGQTFTPKKLIAQLESKFPGEKFNENSEVPEEFVEQIEKLVEAKQQQDQPVGNISKADPKNSMEAIADIRNHQDLISQAIYEALNDQETVLTIQRGFNDGLRLINSYEKAKNQVVNKWAENQVNKLDDESQKLASELENLMIERAGKEQASLGKFTLLNQQTKERLKNTRSFIDSILEVI